MCELKECNASVVKETNNRYRIIVRMGYASMEFIGSSPEYCIGKAHQELQKMGKTLGEVSGVVTNDSQNGFVSETSVCCRYFGNKECDADAPCIVLKHLDCVHL